MFRITLDLGVSDGSLGNAGLISSFILVSIIREQALTMGI